MIAAWKTVDVSYGDLYALILMDDTIFEKQFSALQDENSTWHLFTAENAEIFHTGEDPCADPGRLIGASNSGTVFRNESGEPVSAFSMRMTSPDWTLVREVSMADSEQVVRRTRSTVMILAAVIFLIALAIYRSWHRRFMRQFNSLLSGIIRMGQGELEPARSEPYTIGEFETMQREIDRTSLALNEQMETIRRMEREQMEQENRRREQEAIIRELSMAREIQKNAMPHTFPPFPERKEIELYASMDPARDIGGDFYDYFFVDDDHLCLLIADVSGKGIPAALFMMDAKRTLEDTARTDLSVSEILEKTNEELCGGGDAEMFVTVWIGILEISTGRLSAANAGHEYPAICGKDGRFTLYKDKHGFVLGGMKGVRYGAYDLLLSPGDRIFVYTDGVPEATAVSGEMFGTDRMIGALNTCADGSPEEILRCVRSSVDAFTGEAEQFDDLTMLCFEYRGPQQAASDAAGRA